MEEKKTEDSRVLEATMKAGEILLQSGAEIARVEETMLRISNYFGVGSKEFFVLSNGIFLTAEEKQEQYRRLYHVNK